MLLIGLCLPWQGLQAVDYPAPSLFHYGLLDDGQEYKMPYRYFQPKDYDENDDSTKYPLVVFLHGQGQKGGDNEKQLLDDANGAMIFVSFAQPNNQLNFPCFFVAPQCPSAGWHSPEYVGMQVIAIVNRFIEDHNVDPDRVYITGLSMGADGVSWLLQKSPGTWAAAHVSTGWGNNNYTAFKHVPLWAFDATGDSNWSGAIDEIRGAGGAPVYTHFNSGLHHDTWQRAYAPSTPLVPWMMAQRRGQTSIPAVTPFITGTYSIQGANALFQGTAGDADAHVTQLKWKNLDNGNTGTTTLNAGTWTATVPLRSGVNRISVVATGYPYGATAGNGNTTFTRVFTVSYPATNDTVAPTLSITSPTAGSTYSTSSNPLTVGGTAVDNIGVTSVTWSNSRGGTGTASGTTSWNSGGIALSSGENIITVTAADAAGLTHSRTLTVTYTGLPPNDPPVVSAGPDQQLNLPSMVALSGIATDDNLPTPGLTILWTAVGGPGIVDFQDETVRTTAASFSTAGTYTLRLTATDSGGLSDSDDIVITVHPQQGNWSSADIGTVASPGSFAVGSSSYTLQGSGTDIWGTADAFHFGYQSLTGDGTIVAQVDSMSGSNAWAKAAVMIRSTLAVNSPHAMMCVSPSSGTAFMSRTNAGGGTTPQHNVGAAPVWLKLVRSGAVFTGFQSADGAVWTQVGSATIAMGAQAFIGLAVTSKTTGLNTAVFSNVVIETPQAWSSSDIGGPTPVGTTTPIAGGFRLQAAGSDIWGFNDSFRFMQQTLDGDGTIVARVDQLTHTNNWTKAAVMIRGSLAPNSAHAMAVINPVGSAGLMWRASDGGNSASAPLVQATTPRWISLRRTGSLIAGYISVDGNTWASIGQITLNLPVRAYFGVALTSHEVGTLATAEFTQVSLVSDGNNAVDHPTTASSVETGSANVAVNATDGISTTRWASAASDNEWLQVDLGVATPVSQAILTWETAYGRNYVIEGASSSSGPWTILATKTNGTGGIDTLPLSGQWRYVRMRGTQRGTGWGYSLWEFDVR